MTGHRALRTWSRPGRWTLSGLLLSDGRRIALTEYTKAPSTRVALFDGQRRAAKFELLVGNYEFEALVPRCAPGRSSSTGAAAATTFSGTTFEAAAQPHQSTNPGREDEWPARWARSRPETAVAPTPFTWRAGRATFVHALDLRTGVAHCVDLPRHRRFRHHRRDRAHALPDERRLYLASPFLGRLTRVDLESLACRRRCAVSTLVAGRLRHTGSGPAPRSRRTGGCSRSAATPALALRHRVRDRAPGDPDERHDRRPWV